MECWLEIAEDSDFSIHNLPYGIFSIQNNAPRMGVALGNKIIDLSALAEFGLLDKFIFDKNVFNKPILNPFIALGKEIHLQIRKTIQALYTNNSLPQIAILKNCLIDQDIASMHLPVSIGDYTDFYSSKEHATNVGKLFRDPANALLPNWRHLPVAYHGRSSSIVLSGQSLHRPKGQIMPKGMTAPLFQYSSKVDFELELACIIGKDSSLGDHITTQDADDYKFGMVLMNDWSARDIQEWEYVPLGPFLGKNFGTSISPWVVTMEALKPFLVQGPLQEPTVLPYLQYEGSKNYDIHLEVSISPSNQQKTIVCETNFKHMYWNINQQIAHHTINGCNLRIGDLLGSGTISGQKETEYGSMLELTYNGTKPIKLLDDSLRSFIEDNDTVVMKAYAKNHTTRIGFGELSTKLIAGK